MDNPSRLIGYKKSPEDYERLSEFIQNLLRTFMSKKYIKI